MIASVAQLRGRALAHGLSLCLQSGEFSPWLRNPASRINHQNLDVSGQISVTLSRSAF